MLVQITLHQQIGSRSDVLAIDFKSCHLVSEQLNLQLFAGVFSLHDVICLTCQQTRVGSRIIAIFWASVFEIKLCCNEQIHSRHFAFHLLNNSGSIEESILICHYKDKVIGVLFVILNALLRCLIITEDRLRHHAHRINCFAAAFKLLWIVKLLQMFWKWDTF